MSNFVCTRAEVGSSFISLFIFSSYLIQLVSIESWIPSRIFACYVVMYISSFKRSCFNMFEISCCKPIVELSRLMISNSVVLDSLALFRLWDYRWLPRYSSLCSRWVAISKWTMVRLFNWANVRIFLPQFILSYKYLTLNFCSMSLLSSVFRVKSVNYWYKSSIVGNIVDILNQSFYYYYLCCS